MIRQKLLAFLRGYIVFKNIKWNGFEITLLHNKESFKNIIGLIPYFWDDDVNFTLVVRAITRDAKLTAEDWNFKWRLLDLDGNRIKEGNDNVLTITQTKWMRRIRRGGYWTSGKSRAIVLGNLNSNKNYVLKLKITNGSNESIDETVATFSIKDKTDYYMQIFLILFSIFMTLFFSFLAKGCGL